MSNPLFWFLDYLRSLQSADFHAPVYFWGLAFAALLLVLQLLRRVSVPVALLRSLAIAALFLALADPVKTETSEEQQLIALVDTSYSVPPAGQQEFASLLLPFMKNPNMRFSLLPFAARPANEPSLVEPGQSLGSLSRLLAGAEKRLDSGESDLGRALDTASRVSQSRSMLLLSDGYETAGDASKVAQNLAASGIKIFPLVPDDGAFREARLSIASLYAPVTANAGDFVEVHVAVKNSFPSEFTGRLELWLEREKLYSGLVTVPGSEEKLVTVKTKPLSGGLQRLRAVLLRENNSNLDEAHRWISVKERSRYLLLSGERDDERVLKDLLNLKGYALESIVADGSSAIPTQFEENYAGVILNNVALRQLPKNFLPSLEGFVRSGGGLLLIGGERSYGLGGYIDTELERMSPLKFVPPQTKKRRLNNAIVLLIDKSRSMLFENKILAAKRAALSSIESLKDDDMVSVIGFDSTPFVIIRLDQVANVKPIAERRLQNLTAAGQTNLLPALAAARRSLESAEASRRHIIILSDGRVPPAGDEYRSEIMRLQEKGVTVSTVAVGVEADVPFLKLLSQYGKGAFYHTLDPSQLAQIFLQDIKVATGEKTMKERQDFPIDEGPDGLRSVNIRNYPALRGIVETRPKQEATLELVTPEDGKFLPVLASWNFGEGRVVAFASDANGRWSQPWLHWEGFSRFWSQAVEAIKTKAPDKTANVDFDLRYSVSRKSVDFDLAIFDPNLATLASPKVSAQVIAPGGESSALSFQSPTKGRFRATLENARPGDYKLSLTYGATKFPPLAITLPGQLFGEQRGRGINIQKLSELAYLTGGSMNPSPEMVPTNLREQQNEERLFIPLVILAFLLIILEALCRELGFAFFPRRKHSRPEQGRRPIGNYQEKKKAA